MRESAHQDAGGGLTPRISARRALAPILTATTASLAGQVLTEAILLISLAYTASSQIYTLSNFAGCALPVNMPETSAMLLNSPQYLAADRAANAFFVDQRAVLRLDATTGMLAPVAGNGLRGPTGDTVPTTCVRLYLPQGIAADPAGNIYTAASGNNWIRIIE